ncbi:MAG: CCA tRNA nucleotidyltransferase, partial [Flavobacteriaceae bacterium]
MNRINDGSKHLQSPLFETLKKAVSSLDTEAYVIGGYVRDCLLGRVQKKDIDIVAVGSGIDLAYAVQKLLRGSKKVQVFKNYGTAMVQWNDIALEFVGARKESYSPESRNPKICKGTLEDDQNRRDFTINALALSLNKDNFGSLLDPFNGIQDLQDGILRTPLDPEITYSDDPLRMLRAIRFASQLNFTIESSSFKAITKNANRIDIISKERIVNELHKILQTSTPSKGFKLLDNTGLL